MPLNPQVNSEAASLTPTALISLFLLDLTPIGVNEVLYFHDGANGNFSSVVYAGQPYMPFPIMMDKFAYQGDGQVPRPTLAVSNINGFVSQYLLQNQDLIGTKVTRRRVFARFLDAVNFPNGVSPYTPDANAAYPDEIFYINRKVNENRQVVQFELATAFELDGVKLPSRPMLALICPARYREASTCTYGGLPVTDKSNTPFSTYPNMPATFTPRGAYTIGATYAVGDYVTTASIMPQYAGIPFVWVATAPGVGTALNGPGTQQSIFVADACPKSIAGCRMRFPAPKVLPFNGFGGISRYGFIQSV